MSGGMRTSIMAGAVIVTCLALILMERKEERVAEQDQMPPTASAQETSEESSFAAELKKQENVVRTRIEVTRRVARELIERRLTLLQAATQLRDLDISLAPVRKDIYGAVFRQIYPGRSDDERYCQRAIAVAESELVLEPVQNRSILRRLKEELQREISHGILQLPH
jgi:hypothetical protein